MAKLCNITPQIFNGTEYVDSKLFTSVNTDLKQQGLKGIALRNKTADIYNNYSSKDFINTFGDWKLYQSVKFNKLTDEQANVFNNTYNGNIYLLESKLNLLALNDLYEPILHTGLDSSFGIISTVNQLTNRPIATFTNNSDLVNMANKLNLTKEQLQSNILESKDIYLQEENQYLTPKTLDRITTPSDSIGALYGLETKTAQDNLKLNTDNLTYNVEELSDTYDEAEINLVGKLTASLLISDLDSLKNLVTTLSENDINNFVQNKKINEFIVSKIDNFTQSIEDIFNTKISNTTSDIEKESLETKKNSLINNYSDLMDTLEYQDELGNYSFLYRSVLSLLNKDYNIAVKYENEMLVTESDGENGFITEELNSANWNDRDALSINRSNTVAQEIKFQIAQSISKDYIANITEQSNEKAKYGINEPLSINDVWNTFISIIVNNPTKDSIVNALKSVNTRDYNGNLDTFITNLESDTNLWNSFYSSVSLAVVSVNKLQMGTSNDGNHIILDTQVANYNAFAKNISLQQLKLTLQVNSETNPDYLGNILVDTKNKTGNQIRDQFKNVEKYNPNVSTMDMIEAIKKLPLESKNGSLNKYQWIENRLTQLGLNGKINMNDIHLFISGLLGTNTNINTDPFSKTLIGNKSPLDVLRDQVNKETNPDTKNAKLSEINAIEEKYIQVYNKVINDLVYLTNNLVNIKNNGNFNKSFNERTSINYLANISTIKNYKNISLSYFNENGDMEYSPQYPSFFTTLLNSIIPINGEINYEYVKEKLHDYLQDPSLAKNDFLYNHNGAGLFKVQKDVNGTTVINAKTGLPIIDSINPINPTFLNNIKAYQLSGVVYKDTNKGAKYEYVTGDSWKIVQLQSALKGEFIIPSSDSSRSYVLSLPKYGLKNIFTGKEGTYVSYTKIMNLIGLLDNNGNIVRRTKESLNNDSKIYGETVDKNNNVIGIEWKTIKGLKEERNLDSINLDTVLKLDDTLIKHYEKFRSSKQINAIKRTVDVESDLIRQSYKDMFDVTYSITKEGIRYVNKVTPKSDIQQQANEGKLSAPRDWSGKRTKSTYASSGLEIQGTAKLIENNIPTGKIFEFNRLTYNGSLDGKTKQKITLSDFAKNYIHGDSYSPIDLIDLVARSNRETYPIEKIVSEQEWANSSDEDKANSITPQQLNKDIIYAKSLFDRIFYDFLDTVLEENQKRFISETNTIADELKSTVVDYVPPYIDGTYEGGDSDSPKRRANLISMHLERNITKADVSNKEENDELTPEAIKRQYNRSMLEAFINDYLMSTNIGEDILYGRQYEYKGFKDTNKRVNEVIKNGKSNDSTNTFSSLTISDIETVSNMLDLLKSNNDINNTTLWEQYGKEAKVGDGLSMITVDEYIKRLKSVNMYYGKMKDYIDALTDPNTKFSPNKYSYIAEQLKYYLYTRQANTQGLHKGLMTSYQEKNSTIILFPKMFAGTQYEPIINWMNEKGINELNYLSASKVGGQPVYSLHDIYRSSVMGNQANTNYNLKLYNDNGILRFDDRINRNEDFTDTNRVNIADYLITYKQSDLRIQQDTVPHIYNKEGVLSTQFLKKVWVNMNNDEDYIINGKEYKGRTNDHRDGQRGIFENMQDSMSYNAEQNRDILIDLWGGIKNGEIQYDAQGNINLDIKKVEKSISSYFNQVGDISLMRAFEPSDLGTGTQLSLNHPTIYRQIESLLQAKISDNVKQQLLQIHAPIIPDTFLSPVNYKYNKDTVIRDADLQQLKDNGHISFAKTFWDSQVGQKQVELKSEYYDAEGKFHAAQIVTNVWDKQFEEYRTTKVVNSKDSETYDPSKPTYIIPYIDIDSIPVEARTVVGTRIPHEGMQSSFVAEVVGFMNDDSSQIIVPKHLATRTGWDFDIDTVYIYPKHLYKRLNTGTNKLELQPISYEYDMSNTKDVYNTKDKMLLDYAKTYYSKEYSGLKQNKAKNIYSVKNQYQEEVQKVINGIYRNQQVAINNINKQNPNTISDINKRTILNNTLSNYTNYTDGLDGVLTTIIKDKDLNSKYTNSDISKLIDVLDNDLYDNKTYTYISKEQEIEVSSKLKDLKLQFKNDIKNIQDKYNDDLEQLIHNKDLVSKFDSFDSLKQVTRETRNNMIVDSLQTRLQAKFSTTLREKSNTYATLGDASSAINDIRGLDNNSSNFTNLLDRTSVANMNREVAVLKAQSVANDNTYSVLGTLNCTVGESQAIPIVITKEEFKDNNIENIKTLLNKTVGRNNYEVLEDRIIVYSKYLGNNAEGNWMNTNGNNITSQSSQITSNILDAVKDNLGFNVNSTTLNILSLLANSPVTHYTDILGSIKQDNAFAYSNLIIHQAIITKFLSQINSNQRTSEFANKNNTMTSIRNEMYSNIISLLQKHNLLGDTSDTHVGILDAFRNYLLLDKSNEVYTNMLSTVGSWLASINNGQHISMSDNNAVSTSKVYNELVKFINSKELIDSAVYSYLGTNSDLIDTYNKNNKSESISNIKLSSISNSPIFSYDQNNGYSINNSKSFKTISELNDIYKNSIQDGNYDIDSKIKELNTTETSTDDISKFIQFLDDQIAISKLYEHIDNTGNIINKSARVLRTDKLGTSPNSSTTSELFNDIADLYLDLDAFKQQMRSTYSIEEINNFVNEYSKETNLVAKKNIMQGVIDGHKYHIAEKNSNGERISTKSKLVLTKTPLYVNSIGNNAIPIVESVFPNLVNETMDEGFDFKQSSYPYFEAQLVYANHFSTKAFNNILLAEKTAMKQLLNILMARLNVNTNIGNTKKSNVRGDILNTIINDHVFDNVEFFNGGFTDNQSRQNEVLRVIGKVDIVKKEKSVNNELRTVDEVNMDNVLDNFDVFTSMSTKGQMTLETYKSLSTANQVYLLQNNLQHFANQFEVSDRNDIADFLNVFQSQIDKENLAKNGFHVIKTLNVDRDIRKMKQTFTKMFYNNNPFIRQTAKDLIRYAFHTSGLKFGNNVAKYVDIKLYYKNVVPFYETNDGGLQDEMSKPVNQLYRYNEELKTLETIFKDEQDDSRIEYYLNTIRKQMYDNNLITPLVYNKKKVDQPTFNKLVTLHLNDDILGERAIRLPIIVEKNNLLKNSVWSKNETIRTKIDKSEFNGTFAFKRYDISGSTNTYYYPIVKSLNSEFTDGDTAVSKYSSLIRKYGKSDQDFEAIIRAYDSGNTERDEPTSHNVENLYDVDKLISTDSRANVGNDNYQYVNQITKSNESYTNTAKKIIANVDNVLYIGSDKFNRNAFASDKTIYTTLASINSKTLDSIEFGKPTKLAIVGDNLSDLGITQSQVDNVIVPTIRNYHELFNIDSVKTIFKKGIGESVYKATMTNNNSNEYIELGTSNNVHNVEALSDEAVTNNILSTAINNITDIIASEEKAFTLIQNLRTYTRNIQNASPDTYNFPAKGLQDIIANMNDVDNQFNGLINALNVNMQAVDKILEFIENDGIKFPNEENKTNILTVNIYKYISGDNTTNKVIVSKKLVLYKNILKAANQLLDIKSINVPVYTQSEFDSLSDEDKLRITDFIKKVNTYNATLKSYKSASALNSNGEEMQKGNSRTDYVQVLSSNTDAKIKQYFATIIYMYTRNPKFKDSKFAQITKQIADKDYAENDSKDISPEALSKIFQTSLLYNDDLNFAQLYLDSIRDTGIPLIDNTMSLFSEFKLNSLELEHHRTIELQKIVDNNTNIYNKDFKYSDVRSKQLQAKYFDTSKGKFITKYDYDKFYRDLESKSYESNKNNEFISLFTNPEKEVTINSNYKFINGKIQKLDTSELQEHANMPLKFNQFKRVFAEGNESVKNMLDTIKSDKVTSPLLPENGTTFNYHKLFTFNDGVNDHSVILQTQLNNKLGKSSSIPASTFVETNGQYSALEDIKSTYKTYIADGLESMEEHSLGHYSDLQTNKPGLYDYHMNNYLERGLDTDVAKRKQYEDFYHIKFKDNDLLNTRKFADNKENYSTLLPIISNQRVSTDVDISEIIPNSNYESEKYNKLSLDEKLFLNDVKQYIKNVTEDLFPGRINSEDFTPYIFMSQTPSLGKTLKNFIGWTQIQEEHVELDMFGKPKHFFQANALTKPELENSINVRRKNYDETFAEYEDSVVTEANKRLKYLVQTGSIRDTTGFKNFDADHFPIFTNYLEVKEYNQNALDTFMANNAEHINYDIPAVLKSFSEELYHLKTNIDFEHSYKLLTDIVNSDDFLARNEKVNGKFLIDRAFKQLTGNTTFASKQGSDTNAAKALENWKNVLYKESRAKTKFDQMLNLALRYTSVNTMWLNYHTGIKNVVKGATDLIIEATGNEFINRKELGKGMNEYTKEISNIIGSIGSETAPSLVTAIIKHFNHLFEDHTENPLRQQTAGTLNKISNKAEAIAYSTMTGGEHFLQFSNLLAMMHSHRIVNGMIMSRNEFIGNKKNEVIRKFLNPQQTEDLDNYIISLKNKNSENYKIRDYVTDWLIYKNHGLTKEAMTNIKVVLKDSKKQALEEFEGKPNKDGSLKLVKYKTVFEYFKYDDQKTILDTREKVFSRTEGKEIDNPTYNKQIKNYNYGHLTLEDGMNKVIENEFTRRVQGLNQSIHGIYNTIDRNGLQNMLLFEVVLQFRKWMRANWIRYMGVKSNYRITSREDSNPFSERLGQYRSGAFQDFFKFMKTPFIKANSNKEVDITNAPLHAFRNMFNAQAEFFSNIGFYYNMLSDHEQANIRRTAQFAVNATLITGALLLAGIAYDPDKDKDKFFKPRSWFIYQLAGLQTEYLDLIPVYGWATFYNQTKTSTVPMEMQLTNLAKLMKDMSAYPLQSEEDRLVKAGVYKGESKIKMDIEKATPILRQWHKEEYLSQSINYYGMFNIFVNNKNGAASDNKH